MNDGTEVVMRVRRLPDGLVSVRVDGYCEAEIISASPTQALFTCLGIALAVRDAGETVEEWPC